MNMPESHLVRDRHWVLAHYKLYLYRSENVLIIELSVVRSLENHHRQCLMTLMLHLN